MKFIWEDKDIRSGIIVAHPDREEKFMIGYAGSKGTPTLNSLSDGMVVQFPSRLKLLESLNKSGDVPEKFIEVMKTIFPL